MEISLNFKLHGEAKYVLEMVYIMARTIEYKLTPIEWLTQLANTGRKN